MKIAVLDSVGGAIGIPAQFSQPTIDELGNRHKVTVCTGFDLKVCAEADAVFTEWCNQDAFEAAASGVCSRLVIRCRGADVFGPLEKLRWDRVHALVLESEYLRSLLPKLPVRTEVIPAGISMERFPFHPHGRTNVVAMVARADAAKGYQIAFEWARRHPELELHVTAANGERNQALLRYLWHAMPANVHLYGTVKTVAWLRHIKATFLLVPSVFETLSYVVAEGMALGCKPLIFDFPAAKKLWPEDLIWSTLDELDELRYGAFEPERYRRYVKQHLDARKLTPIFEALLTEGAPTAAPGLALRRLAGAALEAIQAGARDRAAGLLGLLQPTPFYADLCLAFAAQPGQQPQEMQAWAFQSLGGGPRSDALRLLGEAAERAGDLFAALAWYHQAKAAPSGGESPLTFDEPIESRIELVEAAMSSAPP